MWIIIAFLSLGFLVGNLAGLTAETVTSTLLGLLFAFAGGSAIAFMHKLDRDARIDASRAILSLSVACLIGVYVGIFVSEHQFLSPDSPKNAHRSSVQARKYLREKLLPQAEVIDQQKANLQLTTEEAYEKLYELIERQNGDQ